MLVELCEICRLVEGAGLYVKVIASFSVAHAGVWSVCLKCNPV